MKPETIIHAIANGVLVVGVSAFMVMLYRSGGLVEKFPATGSFMLRLALAMTATGALKQCLEMPEANFNELLRTCGLAGIFVWAAFFHANLIKNGPTNQHHPRSYESSVGQAAGTEGSNE